MTKTITIWSYDVWGNEKDGFDVNDRFCFLRDYQLDDDMPIDTDEQLFDLLVNMGFLSEKCKLSDISFDGDDMRIEIEQSDNGYPLGCIEIE